jgi:hypothetical protein
MTSRMISLLFPEAAVLLVLAQGCALTPPVKNSGPTVSTEGIQLAVTRQSCHETQDPDFRDNDLAEAILQIEVRNGAQTPVTVHRDAFRLVTATPDRVYLKTQTWGAAQPMTVNGGAAGTFELRFMTRGSLKCASDLTLDPDTGLLIADHPVKVSSISFRPSQG